MWRDIFAILAFDERVTRKKERNLHHEQVLSLWSSLGLLHFLRCCLDREE